MSKFKVGDKVRFTDAERHCSDPCYYPPVGTIGTIVDDEKSSAPFIKWDEWMPRGTWKYIHEKNPGLAYSVDEWEGALEEDQKIMIYIDKSDPHTVIARNIKTGARSTARCAPQDHFDFYVGAKLAFDRLVGTETTEKKDPGWNGRVTPVDTNSMSRWWTNGKIYKVKDGVLRDDDGDVRYCTDDKPVVDFADLQRRLPFKILEIKD